MRNVCIVFFSLVFSWIGSVASESSMEEPYVNVYNWYGYIPPKILEQFEKETGIKVRYDLYDSNEILVAKLLAGNSGYDVVFPSIVPFLSSLIIAKAVQPLDKRQLPNLKNLDPNITKRMQVIDPNLEHSVPFLWGTQGFAYVEERVKALMPDAPIDNYRMLFDPEVVRRLSSCGISLLEESIDVYSAVFSYLGMDPESDNQEDLKRASEQLRQVRPYISRFLSAGVVSELVNGGICLAQTWVGDVQLAKRQAKEAGKSITIHYVIPEEGTTMWIDVMSIPQGAPHPKNAHKFINFLLRPDIIASITNTIYFANPNKASWRFIDSSIRKDPAIYPPAKVMAKLSLEKLNTPNYEKIRTRMWTEIRHKHS